MQALNEILQARLDTFEHKFGKGAHEDDNRIWKITNTDKPEHERHSTTINGSVISKHMFNGNYEIEFVGYVEPKSLPERIGDRRKKAQEDGKAIKASPDK